MRLMHRISLTIVALATLAPAVPAFAQSQLNVPALRVVDTSRASITLEVQAGGTGAASGFRIEWMRQSDFDAQGGWPANPSTSPLVSRAQFYGSPTWNVSTGTYRLGADDIVRIELGDLFDETGLLTTNYNEMGDFQPFVIRVQATGTVTETASDLSASVVATTKPASQNCTFTQGYWKNHTSAWPVSGLTIGTVSYTAAQLELILQQPANGNGLTILAHQLIAAKLNIAGGADPTPVAAIIAAADAQIGSLVCPPIGSGFLDPADTDSKSQTLDSYNNGNLGVPHCGQVPAKLETWGSVKASYR